jgi:hypothetical protein
MVLNSVNKSVQRLWYGKGYMHHKITVNREHVFAQQSSQLFAGSNLE